MATSRIGRLALLALAIGGFLPAASASTIDAIYAFGDSLSDVGNVFIATGGAEPAPPYANGQFSNGPIWIQDLAGKLGVAPLHPSLAGGTDYAFGGAETGPETFNTANPATDLTAQVAQFALTHPVADPNALYTIWIGSNDLSDILAASPAQYLTDIGAAVSNVDASIGALAADGAKRLLILTVPDLGKTPAAIAAGPLAQAGASALAADFDNALVSSALLLAGSDGLHLSILDTFSLLDGVAANPSHYLLTNVTAPCLTGEVSFAGGTPCANPNQFLFWDTDHPTAAGHAIVADAALTVVTPEPASVSLLAVGLLGAALVFRRRRV
jgi:phospholipase/lecithinase/hemolysin